MHFSRLEDETNRRIDRVRKNIMHDVLIYNLEVETEKRKKKKAE